MSLSHALTLAQAPRIVATQEDRVLLSRGDRAYALGDASQPLLEGPGLPLAPIGRAYPAGRARRP